MEQTSRCGGPPPEDLCFWINSLARAARRCLTGRLIAHDVTLHQFGILMMCLKGCADTVGGLTRVMPIDPAAVSRNVHSLAQRGLLEKEPSQRDRRSTTLSVTGKGEALLAEFAEQVEANNRMLLEGIGEDEARKFTATVKTMLANIAAHEATRSGTPDDPLPSS